MTLRRQLIFNSAVGLAAAPLFVFGGLLGASQWFEPVVAFVAFAIAGFICPLERWAVHPFACLAGGVAFFLSLMCFAPVHFYHGLATVGFGAGLSTGGLIRNRIRHPKVQPDV